MGTTLRQIVEEIGGGAPDGGKIKAVQTGGPSGGCIPAEALDTPVDYESLVQLGSIMGSGGMIVMDETTNMVDVARFFMEFCMDESCGKCIPCRAGTVQLHRMLTRIIERKATADDLDQLETLCDMVKLTSLCGLGQSAPNPVLSTLRYFRDEYLALLGDAAAAPATTREMQAHATSFRHSRRPAFLTGSLGEGGDHGSGQDPVDRRKAHQRAGRPDDPRGRRARRGSRYRRSAISTGSPDVGACRLCLVEVGDPPRLMPACTTRSSRR